MLFEIVDFFSPATHRDQAFLMRNNWDDWFTYETTFVLVVFDSQGNQHNAGRVKIGQLDQVVRKPDLPARFEALGKQFFSLGQDEDYYETLNSLEPSFRDQILSGLRDVAADLALFDQVKEQRVMTVSLMRSVAEESVRGRFHRLARGDAKLTPFNFAYEFPKSKQLDVATPTLSFEVIPESMPPTNIHVLIGRNGVGKTRCLNRMTRSLVEQGAETGEVGSFSSASDSGIFASVVSVSFSAFDPFDPLVETREKPHLIPYYYIGLRPEPSPNTFIPSRTPLQPTPPVAASATKKSPKTPEELIGDFVKSATACRIGTKSIRWRSALVSLESDPLFKEAEVSQLAIDTEDQGWPIRAGTLYMNLSSGHKIVLLTLTRLVEMVAERTLVLLDEPEAHLHPPLLAAFVRSLSDLLIQRNGVAIIATHSPVVLQEAPKTCVWLLRRSGSEVRADRPENETFGENVGVLTREVFSLEVTQSGFHKLLQEAVAESGSYEAVLARFNHQLGAEARAIARGLTVNNGNNSME
ncbi:AAA family ATPase [Melittangium boletus]|uniref:AAA family ATPase n=1 Tax=Melittangium boletus TaxID=83453 RepID=UPI003DA48B87